MISLVECDAMQSGRLVLEFWMNLLPLSSFTLKMEVASFF